MSTVVMRCTWRVSPWPMTETVSSVCALSAVSAVASVASAAWALAAESAIATAIVRYRVCMMVHCMGDGHRPGDAVHGHYANGT
ncbi:hypothetical protein D3C72_1830860 [compost metagenome]